MYLRLPQADARWRRGVPAAIRALDTLVDPDYTDVFTAEAREAPPRPLDRWFRSVMNGVPGGLRRFTFLAQRGLLGLRLDPRPAPDRLIGWRFAGGGDDWFLLEATSWMLTGHVVFQADGRHLSFATFVRYDHAAARLVWPPVSLIHRQVGLALMRYAASAGPGRA